MSRFPKLTETFVLFEILGVQDAGWNVDIYPLLRARNTSVHPEGGTLLQKILELRKRPQHRAVMHPDAAPLVERAHFAPFLNGAILRAQVGFLIRRPWVYLRTLCALVRANWGSANYLVGSLAVFPKVVYFARQMQQDGVTHIHAHFANHPAAAAYVIHALTGIPYSFTAHGADLQVDQHMLREKVHAATHVITISDVNKEFIIRHCGEAYRDCVKVIRCGVDLKVFRPCDDRVPRRNGRPLTILCVGTLYEVKGHTYLIDACRLLDAHGIRFACHLIGDGPLRQSFERRVEEAGLCGKVVFRGRLTRDRIAAQLRRADVLVAPSVPTASGRREGIPVVLMEAMASGVPVVASRISGIPELIDDEQDGLLVPPRDPEALAAALQRLYQDRDLCERLARAARQKVRLQYNLDTNVRRLCNLFDSKD